MQVGTRVWAAGAWRALDTAAMFKQQGAIRALGAAVIAASPELAAVLDRHGLTLNPVTGEITELEPFNALMSKRGAQVRKNLERLEAEWEAAHPGETMGPVVSSRLTAKAWAFERPAKKPTTTREEAEWLTELREAGYDPETLTRKLVSAPAQSDELSVQEIASRALDRCAAGSSAWTRHDVQEHATRIITGHGVRATPEELRELIALSTALALEDCFSILPTGAAAPEHVAHLTSLRVVQVESELRDLLTARLPKNEQRYRDVSHVAARFGHSSRIHRSAGDRGRRSGQRQDDHACHGNRRRERSWQPRASRCADQACRRCCTAGTRRCRYLGHRSRVRAWLSVERGRRVDATPAGSD
jgi:hypothetical protein